jgi:5-methylcytosine-specific restriction protein A
MRVLFSHVVVATASLQRTQPYASRVPVERGPGGRNLCRHCHREVPQGRRTFCGPWCIEEWRIRTDPAYLRRRVFLRDRGVCGGCGFDVPATREHLYQLRRVNRAAYEGLLAELGVQAPGAVTWEADHRVEVARGGGCCGLDNLVTLCWRCHRRKSAALPRLQREDPLMGEAEAAQHQLMDIQRFVEEGYLQEVNRLFFHPRGLALVAKVHQGRYRLHGVWVVEDDPEGPALPRVDPVKVARVEARRERFRGPRAARFGGDGTQGVAVQPPDNGSVLPGGVGLADGVSPGGATR